MQSFSRIDDALICFQDLVTFSKIYKIQFFDSLWNILQTKIFSKFIQDIRTLESFGKFLLIV